MPSVQNMTGALGPRKKTTITAHWTERDFQHMDTLEWKVKQDPISDIQRARDKLEERIAEARAENQRFENHPKRRIVNKFLHSHAAEAVIFVAIFTNFVLTIYETDVGASSANKPQWIWHSSVSFLLFFVTELSLRFYVFGPNFFNDASNTVDLIVVLIDVSCTIADLFATNATPGPAVLRVFRVMRVARAIRMMKQFHELYLMVYSLISTLRAIFWAVILVFMVLTCCSIFAVEYIHPINLEVQADGVYDGSCSRCPHAFRSVMEANLTFVQQIIAGDSWGLITLPIVHKAPWTLAFFLIVLLIVHLGLMNLVLTVIVERASQARQENIEENLVSKLQSFRSSREQLMQLCASMDSNLSGTLSVTELMHGYDSNPRFAHYLNSMDIKRDDLPLVFKILDRDGSGDVSYGEYVEGLHRLKSQDSHTMLVFMNYHLNDLLSTVRQLSNMMVFSGDRASASVPFSVSLRPSEALEETESDTQSTVGNNQPADMRTTCDDDEKDDDAIDHVGQLAEATLSGKDLPRQSSTRKFWTTPAANSPQPGAPRKPSARPLTQPEWKNVQDSITKAIETIVRESLAISYERVIELINQPDFLGLLQGLDTSQWTGDISNERFLPDQMDNREVHRRYEQAI